MIGKNTRRLFCLRSTAGSSIARAGDRPTTCSRARRRPTRGDRHEEKRSKARGARRRAEHGVISGGEILRSSRAAVISGSSCRSHLQLDPRNFGLRRCDLMPETRTFLGTRHAEKNGRVDDLYKVYEVEERYNCC